MDSNVSDSIPPVNQQPPMNTSGLPPSLQNPVRKNYRKLIYILIAAAAVLLVFGCYFFVRKYLYKNTTPIPGQKVSIEYWGLYESEQVMNPLIAQYEKANPNVDIHYVEKSFTDLDSYKRTLQARSNEGSAPTIYRVHSSWVDKLQSHLSDGHQVVNSQEFSNRFYDAAKNPCVRGGTGAVVCIPLMYDGLVLAYNIDMFKDSGVAPNLQSWEDLRLAAKKLTRYSDDEAYDKSIIRAGVSLGTSNNITNFSDILVLMMFQSGIENPNDFTADKVKAIFKFYTDFANEDEVWDPLFPESISAFASERSAMVFVKASQIVNILKVNPTINMGVLPVPQLPVLGGGITNDQVSSSWVEVVSSDAPSYEQSEAWKFLEWMSRPEQELARFNESSKYKKFGEAYSNKQLRNTLINSPFLGPVIKSAPTARATNFNDDAGNTEYVNLIRQLMEATSSNSSTSVDQALADFKSQYSSLHQGN